MVKVRYKEISEEMNEMVKPDAQKAQRFSLGMEDKIGEYYYIDLEKLKPYRNQARSNFNPLELEELASTIKEHGMRQPLSVMPSPDEGGFYEIISGERRFRAAKIVGLKTVPCLIIKDVKKAEEIALIENIQRADLHPVELANAYHNILEKSSYGGVSDLAKKIGKPVSTISETSKLHKLPGEIKKHLIDRNIRSKIVFRKLAVLEGLDEMRSYLGIGGTQSHAPQSVLRITLNANEFVFEKKAIERLSMEQKEKLKSVLRDIVESL